MLRNTGVPIPSRRLYVIMRSNFYRRLHHYGCTVADAASYRYTNTVTGFACNIVLYSLLGIATVVTSTCTGTNTC